MAEAAETAGVSLTLARDVRLWRATLWPEVWRDASAAILGELGVAAPAPGASVAGPFGRLWRPAPTVWALLDPPGEGPPRAFETVGPLRGAVAELGPGLARVTLTGARAAELLARVVTLDLRARSFAPGGVRVTGWRETDVTLIRPEAGGWELLVPLSFAEDAEAMLRRLARPLGGG